MSCSIPLVSVCCITYNHEQFIQEAVDSFLMQKTDFAMEIIIHDDASTDTTQNIIKKYQEKHPDLIKLILRTENQYTKRGFGFMEDLFKEAQGKYIALCEGDDYWTDPLKLQKQVDFLEANPEYSGAFHQTQLLKEDGTWGDPLRWWQDLGERLDITFEDTISTRPPFHTSSFLFRLDRLTLPKDFSRYSSGDMALFVILSSQGNFRQIPEYMSVYRKHPSGITETSDHKDVVRLLLSRLYLFISLRNYLYPKGYENFNLLIDSMYESIAIVLLDRSNIKILPKYVNIILKCTSISLRAKILAKMAIFFIAHTLDHFIFRIKCLVPRRLKNSIRYLIENYQQDIR